MILLCFYPHLDCFYPIMSSNDSFKLLSSSWLFLSQNFFKWFFQNYYPPFDFYHNILSGHFLNDFFPTSIFILIIFNITFLWLIFSDEYPCLNFFKTMFVWMILSDKYRMILNLFYLSSIFLVFYYIFYFNAYFKLSTLPWFFFISTFLETFLPP